MISLLSPFGRLLEHFPQRRINWTIKERRILKDYHFGCGTKHSIIYALAAFATFVTDGFKTKMGTNANGLNFTKAFDTVWQHSILYKMESIGLDG